MMEQKVFFPLMRGFFLLVGVLALLGIGASLVFLTLSLLGSAVGPSGVHVPSDRIMRQVQPFGTAQQPDGTPFGRATSPSVQLGRAYPGTQADELARLIGGSAPSEAQISMLASQIASAEALGDTPRGYISNAVEVLTAVPADRRQAAMELYQEDRMQQLMGRRIGQGGQLIVQSVMAGSILYGLMILGFVSILLAVLAIERNTRGLMLQASTHTPGTRSSGPDSPRPDYDEQRYMPSSGA